MNNKIVWTVIAIVLVIFGAFALSSDNEKENDEVDANQSLSLSDIHGLEVDINDSDRLYLPNHQGLYVQGADGTKILFPSGISSVPAIFALIKFNMILSRRV